MDPDEIQATLDNMQSTITGLAASVNSMSDMMDYNFSQLVGFGQGGENAPTTSSTAPNIAQQDAGAANIVPPSLFGNQFEQLFGNLTRWIEESMPSLVNSASAGETNQGGGQFSMENYLTRTREIESGGNDSAVSSTGASGPYQFTEGTWNETKDRLANQGHPEAANWTLQDRFDPEKSRLAAENLAEFNRAQLQRNVRGEIGEVETYSAHLLGAQGATNLLNADPNSLAKDSISESALKANEGIFKGTGVGIDQLTAKQLIDSIAQFYGSEPASRSGSTPSAPTSGPNASMASIMGRVDRMADSGMPAGEIWGDVKKMLEPLTKFGVNAVGPEIGANYRPNVAMDQGKSASAPRRMSPSPSTADDTVGGGVPNPNARSDIFDFINYFGLTG